jgi:hypothetical protein
MAELRLMHWICSILILPKRWNGTESVVMVRGTRSRITITFSGFEGMSFEDIVDVCVLPDSSRQRSKLSGDGEFDIVVAGWGVSRMLKG